MTGDRSWSGYAITLKARKLGGDEGFVIFFGLESDDDKSSWTLGGWGNTRHVLQLPDGGAATAEGKIESDRWCDIRVELQGSAVKAFLDGKLVQQTRRRNPPASFESIRESHGKPDSLAGKDGLS